MKRINLFEKIENEINELIASGKFTAPTDMPLSGLTQTPMSDRTKAIYTLQQTNSAALQAKLEQLEEMHDQPARNRTGSSRAVKLGPVLLVMTHHKIDPFTEILHENLSSIRQDSAVIEQIKTEAVMLKLEQDMLSLLMAQETIEALGYNRYANTHFSVMANDFSIYTCPCADEDDSSLRDVLNEVNEFVHIIQLPADNQRVLQLVTTLARLQEANVHCEAGFIPNLDTETTKTVFLPKDLTDTRLYEDVGLTESGAMKETAEKRKAELQELINAIVNEGTPYVPEKVNEEEAAMAD